MIYDFFIRKFILSVYYNKKLYKSKEFPLNTVLVQKLIIVVQCKLRIDHHPMSHQLTKKFGAIPETELVALKNFVFTNLRHLPVRLYLVPLYSLLRPFVAIGDPFELLEATELAWPQIRGWDHRSIFEPTTKRAFQSCSLTWQRCHNIEDFSCDEKRWTLLSLFCP